MSLVQYTKAVGDDSLLAIQSYLNFVDLAGSEKISNYFGSDPTKHKKADTCVDALSQKTRLKEGLSINKSLFNLTQVIHTLSAKSGGHIPFRNSSLTKILKGSLSGNSRTTVIVCITPASRHIEQTLDSLKFG